MRIGCGKRTAAAMAGALILLGCAASPGHAGRFDVAVSTAATPSRPKCPPKIIAKCKKDEKPVCVRFKDQCCLTFRCDKKG